MPGYAGLVKNKPGAVGVDGTRFPLRVLMFDMQHSKDTVQIMTLSEHDKLHNPHTMKKYLLRHDYVMARMYELVHDLIEHILYEQIANAPNGFSQFYKKERISLYFPFPLPTFHNQFNYC